MKEESEERGETTALEAPASNVCGLAPTAPPVPQKKIKTTTTTTTGMTSKRAALPKERTPKATTLPVPTVDDPALPDAERLSFALCRGFGHATVSTSVVQKHGRTLLTLLPRLNIAEALRFVGWMTSCDYWHEHPYRFAQSAVDKEYDAWIAKGQPVTKPVAVQTTKGRNSRPGAYVPMFGSGSYHPETEERIPNHHHCALCRMGQGYPHDPGCPGGVGLVQPPATVRP